jgi:hypothetical protein
LWDGEDFFHSDWNESRRPIDEAMLKSRKGFDSSRHAMSELGIYSSLLSFGTVPFSKTDLSHAKTGAWPPIIILGEAAKEKYTLTLATILRV